MLKDDYELSRKDVQDLAGRDALAAFFAKLGYDTNERLVQHNAAMGFTSDLLKSSIVHIERLASEDAGLLEVYLVELKSVTATVTQVIVRAFRNLNVQHPLLVLTDDYKRLDFVLVERYTSTPGEKQEESDVMHDLLAFLAEEMMRLNKEKRAAQREFLDWLVTTLKLLPDKEGRRGIDVLTGKAKLAAYPGDYQKGEPPLATGELLDILRKNKGHLGVSLSDVGLLDRVGMVYEESLQRVLPLKERLARTDRLIDTVVYRLYGLTEEEIKIVEGKG